MKKVLFLLLVLAIVIGCKKDHQTPECNCSSSEIDSTNVSHKKQNRVGKNQAGNKYLEYSLGELLAMYAKRDTSAYGISKRDTIAGEIVRRHEITDTLYAKYRDEFWKQPTTYVHEIDVVELREKLSNATDRDYVQFTFSDKKVANDFNYQVVKIHAFNSYVSCYPVVLLKQMINDTTFRKVVVGKGIKELRNPPTRYDGKFAVAMLKYFDQQGGIQYFDIVEDPSVGKATK